MFPRFKDGELSLNKLINPSSNVYYMKRILGKSFSFIPPPITIFPPLPICT